MAARTLTLGRLTAGSLLVLLAAAAATWLAFAWAPSHAQDAPVRRVWVIEHWRKEQWTAEKMLELMQRHPDAVLSLGYVSTGPTGSTARRWPELRKTVDRLQALARERQIDIAGRIAFPYRIYVHRPFKEGWRECQPHCGWEGTDSQDAFDPAWIATVPRSHHEEMVRKNLDCDPFAAKGWESCWSSYVDGERIRALQTAERVPALYGTHKGANGVLLDVRKPEPRQWMYRRMVRRLPEAGLDPGDPAIVVELTAKPGWMVHYPDALVDTGDPCWESGSYMWTGPAKRCRNLSSPGGPFHYVGKYIYGPGEYERSYNLQIREMKAALEAAGYKGALISTAERPAYARTLRSNGRWSTLTAETRRLPYLLGERISRVRVPGLGSVPLEK